MGGAVRGLMLVLGLPIPCDSRGGYGFQQVEQCVGDHRHPVADHHKRTADGGADQVDRRIAAVVHAHHLRQLGVRYQPAQHRVGCAAKQPGSRAQHQSENDHGHVHCIVINRSVPDRCTPCDSVELSFNYRKVWVIDIIDLRE